MLGSDRDSGAGENPRRDGAAPQSSPTSRRRASTSPRQRRYAGALPHVGRARASSTRRWGSLRPAGKHRRDQGATKPHPGAAERHALSGSCSARRLTLRDEMSDILAQLFRIPVNGKPITILDICRGAVGGAERRGLGLVPAGLRLRDVERRRRSRSRSSARKRTAMRRAIKVSDSNRPSGPVPDRQRGPQIRRLAVRRQPTAVGSGAGPPVGVQHAVRVAHDQSGRPGHRARRVAGSLARADELSAGAAQRRGDRGRRRRVDADADLLSGRRPEGRRPRSATASFTARLAEARVDGGGSSTPSSAGAAASEPTGVVRLLSLGWSCAGTIRATYPRRVAGQPRDGRP